MAEPMPELSVLGKKPCALDVRRILMNWLAATPAPANVEIVWPHGMLKFKLLVLADGHTYVRKGLCS